MAAQKRVNVNHAFVIYVFVCIEREDALSCQLRNRIVKPSQSIATVREWNLRKDDNCEDDDEDLAFHFEYSARDRMLAPPSILEIDFRHSLGDAAAKLHDLNVLGMNCVGIQHRPVAEKCHQPGIV